MISTKEIELASNSKATKIAGFFGFIGGFTPAPISVVTSIFEKVAVYVIGTTREKKIKYDIAKLIICNLMQKIF